MNLIEVFRGFAKEAIFKEYPAGVRVLFEVVMYKLNEARWASELAFSERELVQLTQLKKTTLHEAKKYLEARGMLRCRATARTTYYSLGDELLAKLGYVRVDGASTETTSQVDITESQSTESQSIESTSTKPTTRRPLADHRPTTDRPLTDHSPTTFENYNITRARISRSIDIQKGECVHEIFQIWADEKLKPLSKSEERELLRLVDKHGIDKVTNAIETTHRTRYYPTFNDFLKVLKGGEKDENPARVGGYNRQSGRVRSRTRIPDESSPRASDTPRYTEEPSYDWLDKICGDDTAESESVTETVSESDTVFETATESGTGRSESGDVPGLRRDDVPENNRPLDDGDAGRSRTLALHAVPIRGSTAGAFDVAFVENPKSIHGQNARRLSRRRS